MLKSCESCHHGFKPVITEEITMHHIFDYRGFRACGCTHPQGDRTLDTKGSIKMNSVFHVCEHFKTRLTPEQTRAKKNAQIKAMRPWARGHA